MTLYRSALPTRSTSTNAESADRPACGVGTREDHIALPHRRFESEVMPISFRAILLQEFVSPGLKNRTFHLSEFFSFRHQHDTKNHSVRRRQVPQPDHVNGTIRRVSLFPQSASES